MKRYKLALISIFGVFWVNLLVDFVDIPFFMDKISRGSYSLRENIISIAKVAIPLKDSLLRRTVADKLARIHSTGACQFCDLTQSNITSLSSSFREEKQEMSFSNLFQSSGETRKGMDLIFPIYLTRHKGLDLRYANLARANLYGTNLTGANLRGANLSGANLSGEVDLSGANLSKANLNGANLSRTNLRGVNLSEADLNRANLSRANLSRANLSRANLSRTYLKGVYLNEANLSEANLTEAIVAPYAPTNLETTSVGDDFISVSWTDNAHDELGYNVYISSGKKPDQPIVTLSADVTSYTFDNLKAENYRIWINAVGRSLNSDVLMKIQGTIGAPPNPHKVDKSKGEWSLLVIPDTQHYVDKKKQFNAPLSYMADAFDWIVFVADDLNIKMVQGLGDITEHNIFCKSDFASECDSEFDSEWENASDIWYKLEGKVPFAPNIGNHDDQTKFKFYFPEYRFVNEPWWGGNFNGIINSYQLMTIGNEDYLFANMDCPIGCGKRFEHAKKWIDRILFSYQDRMVILATHDIWQSPLVREQIIRQHDNIVLTNAGHTEREKHFIENGPIKGVSNNFVVTFQDDETEIMLLRFYVFKPLEDKVYFYTYSPITNEFEVDESSQGSFDLVQSDPF